MKNPDTTAGRLVAISNRTAAGQASKAGGLAIAVWEALTKTQGLWVGWSGTITDYPRRGFKQSFEDPVTFALCDLSKAQYEGFYLGFSNSVLWPVLHSRIDLAQFDADAYAVYYDVNRLYAEGLMEMLEPSDTLWVHDYHFLLLAKALRGEGWRGKTGFFLHTPFPSPGVFSAIPQHRALGEALLCCDVIGLQTSNDVANLIAYFRSEFGAAMVTNEVIRVGGKSVVIRHCPIGIDPKGFGEDAVSDQAQDASDKLITFLKDRKLVIGVDRLDYSKGLLQRFEGMATLFDKHTDLHGSISFTQIAPVSRENLGEYAQLREELDALCGRINGDYGDLDWIPIRYLARGYPREEIAGIFRLARVGLVTPLMDGMNLVAKEFIAAQDPADPGVLVLSQFAGAAEQMHDALIINPHDVDAIASAVKQALDMSLEERRSRHAPLLKGIQNEDINWWRNRFLSGFSILEGLA